MQFRPVAERSDGSRLARAPVVLIGGGTSANGAALGAFIDLARGRDGGRIVALTSASGDPDAAARGWLRDFAASGCRNVEIPVVASRKDAHDQRVVETIAGADGIFLGGGDQVRLVSLIGGTPVGDAIHRAHSRGIVVGGTSAGAAALAKTTLAGNETDDHGDVVEQYIGPGLGVVAHPAIIDTHFSERRRLYRLFVALAEYPDIMGLGIDEDTALVVRGDVGSVVGAGGVTFVDGRDVVYSNAWSRDEGTPLTLSAVRVGIIGAGNDDRSRRARSRAESIGRA